jgi:hypothetical protein
MSRQLVLATVAGTVMIVAGAAVFLLGRKSAPSVGAQSTNQSNPQNSRNEGQTAIGAVVLGKAPDANAPAVPTAEEVPADNTAAQRKEEPGDPRLWSPAESTVREHVVQEIRGVVPEAVPLLIQEELEPAARQEVFTVLLRVLKAARSSSPSMQPALLLAADLLADKVDFGMNVPPTPPEIREKLNTLARYGLSYKGDGLGASWVNSHDLLWRVWHEFPSSPWAEDAFLLLLAHGWYTGFNCEGGSDAFRPIIREGEGFLATHPQSRYRREVTYQIAKAYETWWSLSRAKACRTSDEKNCDEYVNPEDYQEGAEEARRKTIEYYEQVLATDSDDIMSADARRHLDDLKDNLDTVERRFYCIYD